MDSLGVASKERAEYDEEELYESRPRLKFGEHPSAPGIPVYLWVSTVWNREQLVRKKQWTTSASGVPRLNFGKKLSVGRFFERAVNLCPPFDALMQGVNKSLRADQLSYQAKIEKLYFDQQRLPRAEWRLSLRAERVVALGNPASGSRKRPISQISADDSDDVLIAKWEAGELYMSVLNEKLKTKERLSAAYKALRQKDIQEKVFAWTATILVCSGRPKARPDALIMWSMAYDGVPFTEYDNYRMRKRPDLGLTPSQTEYHKSECAVNINLAGVSQEKVNNGDNETLEMVYGGEMTTLQLRKMLRKAIGINDDGDGDWDKIRRNIRRYSGLFPEF